MQPKLKSKVRCADHEIGEVTKVIVDPLSHEISHLVVSVNGAGERQVSMGVVQTVTDDLACNCGRPRPKSWPCRPSSATICHDA